MTARSTTFSKVTADVTQGFLQGCRSGGCFGTKGRSAGRRSAIGISDPLAGRRRPAGRRLLSGLTACRITAAVSFTTAGPPSTFPAFSRRCGGEIPRLSLKSACRCPPVCPLFSGLTICLNYGPTGHSAGGSARGCPLH